MVSQRRNDVTIVIVHALVVNNERKTVKWANGLHGNDGNGNQKRITETETNGACAHNVKLVSLVPRPMGLGTVSIGLGTKLAQTIPE